ncbi:sensor histidine kinase [Thiolinea disciformis]|uniref:sensor histidine kinase n=1 Tax=Thiolinea disciformis TaxID=125614 RepID=UPI00037D9DDF|nr:ATP-binding protein [Thiolinea disciformis]
MTALFGRNNLSRRFLIFLFSVLGLVSLSFLFVFYFFYSKQIADERTQASESVSLLLKSSLERSMLRRDLTGLQEIVSDLGKQPGIRDVLILNPSGEIRFASDTSRLGTTDPTMIRDFCPSCSAEKPPTEASTRFIAPANGHEVLRTFHPVHNKAECMACHGEASKHPVNGILVVDYDAEPIKRKGQINILMLMGAGLIAMLFSAVAAWWFMQRNILKPVAALDSASQALSQGDMTARAPLNGGKDEMANLAFAFNQMAETLQKNHRILKHREQFLQGLIDAIPDGVRVINNKYEIIAANNAYADQTGVNSPQELRYEPCYKITYQRETPCPPSLRTCPVHELHTQTRTLKFMEHLQREDGSVLPTEVYAARLPTATEMNGDFLVVEAVRDLQKAVQYSHEQKLASLGELAAGVAHEIHNPLASVRIALQASDQILSDSQEDTTELKDYLRLVDEKVEQCLAVTHRLMKMGTLASNYPELVEVNTVIRETLSLLRFEREQLGITEVLNLSEQPLRILAADNDLRMIILNLAQNAFHAMPQGGEFKVASLKKGDDIQIHIQDSGVGIPAENLPYIFDPFFSRRSDEKKGSGLGLTIALALTHQHQGELTVAAHNPGKTLFILSFPDADAQHKDNI